MNEKIVQYLQQQIRTTDERLARFTHSPRGEKYPTRFMFVKVKQYVDDFLQKISGNRIIIIPGFRGVGKTTLMSQVCSKYKSENKEILFLSVEDAKTLLDVGIAELMTAYEEILGCSLEKTDKQIIIFLDEIQSDPKWALTLKSLFEKTTNIFFCCTGSSAVVLQTTPNLARRAIFEKMPPICFTEYQMIRNSVYPKKGLKEKIRQAIYFSQNAGEVHSKLIALKAEVNQYWAKVDRKDVKKYLTSGTLPFALTMPNESAVYDSISLLIDKIIKLDLPMLGNFDEDTLNAVKRILFVLAENDTTSLASLEKIFKINRLTIASVLETLEKAELLIRVPAYGSNMSVAKKPVKYLFMSPAIRMAFFYFTGQEATFLGRQGKLLEDSVGAHLYREFILRSQGAIRYDSAQGGADFILQIQNNKQIIIEVGMGKKDKRQLVNSIKKINADYSLVFSSTELQVDAELQIVFVPLDYYFLM